MVIVDEAHYIKNDSVRSRRTLELLGVAGKQAVGGPRAAYLLTGTPMANRPRDLFNLLKAVRHPLATSFYRLRPALLRGVRQRLRPRLERRVEPRRARHDPVRGDAAPHQVRSARPAREGALVGSRRGPDRPGPRRRTTGPRLPRRPPGALAAPRGSRSSACSTRPATPSPSPRRRPPPTSSPTASTTARRSSCSRSYTAVVETIRERFGDACVTLTGADDAVGRDRCRRSIPDRRRGPGVRRQPPRRRGRDHPDRRHPRRVQRPRLGARQPLAGRGPRSTASARRAPTFATYLHAAGTLDDYVAALLEQKAATSPRSRTPRRTTPRSSTPWSPRRSTARRRRRHRRRRPPPRPTMGLLDDTLDLLERFQSEQLAAHSGEEIVEFAERQQARASSTGAPHQRRRRVRLPRLQLPRQLQAQPRGDPPWRLN